MSERLTTYGDFLIEAVGLESRREQHRGHEIYRN